MVITGTYFSHRNIEVQLINEKLGYSHYSEKLYDFNDFACVVIQSPNYYGLIEDWNYWSKAINKETIIIFKIKIFLLIISVILFFILMILFISKA